MNRATIKGRVGRLENKVLNNGTHVCKLAIATDKRWKDDNGQWQTSEPTWHDITVYGKLAEKIQRYYRKGDMLLIEGELATDKWVDKNTGQNKFRYYIKANYAEKIDIPKRGETNGNVAPQGNYQAPMNKDYEAAKNGYMNDIQDDDVPF